METAEIMRIASHTSVNELIEARELYRASLAEYLKQYAGDSECSTWSHICALACVYNAGRIQGIRDERRKRRGE